MSTKKVETPIEEPVKTVNPTVLIKKPTKKVSFFGHEKEFGLLCEMYKAHSPSGREGNMIGIVERELNKMGLPYNIDKYGQIYRLLPGTPLLCAHMDQVGHEEVSMLYVGNEVITGDANIGADDKNGCWIILQALKRYKENVSFLFTTNEERGGNIRAFMADRKEILKKMKYCLVLDRRHNSDIIGASNDYCRKDFEEDIEELSAKTDNEFKGCKGGSGDANKLKELMACVNLSCGYHDPHSESEWTDIEGIKNALQLVNTILRNITKKYKTKGSEKKKVQKALPNTGTRTYSQGDYAANRLKGKFIGVYTQLQIAKRHLYDFCLAKKAYVLKPFAVTKMSCKTCLYKKFKDTKPISDFTKKRCAECLNQAGKQKPHTAWTPMSSVERSCQTCTDGNLDRLATPCVNCLRSDERPWWIATMTLTKDYPINRPTSIELRLISCTRCEEFNRPAVEEPCLTCKKSIMPIHPAFVEKTYINPEKVANEPTRKKFKTINQECTTCANMEGPENETGLEESCRNLLCLDCADGNVNQGVDFPEWEIAPPEHFLKETGQILQYKCITCEYQTGNDNFMDKDNFNRKKCAVCLRSIFACANETEQWMLNLELVDYTQAASIKLIINHNGTEEPDLDETDDTEEEESLCCPNCFSANVESEAGDSGYVTCGDCHVQSRFSDLIEFDIDGMSTTQDQMH